MKFFLKGVINTAINMTQKFQKNQHNQKFDQLLPHKLAISTEIILERINYSLLQLIISLVSHDDCIFQSTTTLFYKCNDSIYKFVERSNIFASCFFIILFFCKILLKYAEQLKMSDLQVFHLNRGNDLVIVLTSVLYISLHYLSNNSFR